MTDKFMKASTLRLVNWVRSAISILKHRGYNVKTLV